MKTTFPGTLLITAFLFFACSGLHAQEIIKQEPCDSLPYKVQIDSLKGFFKTRGFEVLREASMQMQSEYEMPIIVPMHPVSYTHLTLPTNREV